MAKKRLLFIGDSPECQSGFGRAARETLDVLRHVYDVTVMGINYRGDPHTLPYPLYAAMAEGDAFGYRRTLWMCELCQPDVIWIQNDGWNIPMYVRALKGSKKFQDVPIVASVAIDGKNFNGGWLNGISLAVFWTTFARNEAMAGNYAGQWRIIPLGVDTHLYRPMPKLDARRALIPSGDLDHAFIIGNVNRNQPRKRWDLTIRFFARWLREENAEDVFLYLHSAPTGDLGIHIEDLARYYGVLEHLALFEPPTFYGATEERMAQTYNAFDVCISTTQGEGFGLTTLEAMACGTPCIAPDWSALGDWPRDAIDLVPCTSTHVGPPYVNVVGGVPDEEQFVKALSRIYHDDAWRKRSSERGLARAYEPRFRWADIGQRWIEAIDSVLPEPAALTADEQTDADWQDLGRPEASPEAVPR